MALVRIKTRVKLAVRDGHRVLCLVAVSFGFVCTDYVLYGYAEMADSLNGVNNSALFIFQFFLVSHIPEGAAAAFVRYGTVGFNP